MSAYTIPVAVFRLGRIVATPNARETLTQEDILTAIQRQARHRGGGVPVGIAARLGGGVRKRPMPGAPKRFGCSLSFTKTPLRHEANSLFGCSPPPGLCADGGCSKPG